MNWGEETEEQNTKNQISCTLLYKMTAEVTIPAHMCTLMCD